MSLSESVSLVTSEVSTLSSIPATSKFLELFKFTKVKKLNRNKKIKDKVIDLYLSNCFKIFVLFKALRVKKVNDEKIIKSLERENNLTM